MAEQVAITGHSRELRNRLKAARKRRGMSQDAVAHEIAERMGKDSLTGAAVSAWEKFERHPAIDVMATWARVVGLRLVVELDDARGERLPVLLRPRTAELARALDVASDEDFNMVRMVAEKVVTKPNG